MQKQPRAREENSSTSSVAATRYADVRSSCTSRYLWRPLCEILAQECPAPAKVFEIGCGNGATANMLTDRGYDVTGVDPSTNGISLANQAFPKLALYDGDAYQDLAERFGRFPVVISLEVIEHCLYPRRFAATFSNLMLSGGLGIISTPYHGYLKNLALAVAGKMDTHWSPLWDGGHIKFFSCRTLGTLLTQSGFRDIRFVRVGRPVPWLAKSMIAVFRR